MKEFLTEALPNWIMAIAAAWGVFEIIRGYFKLRRQQLENTQNLNYLNEQVNEARKQTAQFEYHTNLMDENNKILEKGIAEILMYLTQTQKVEVQGLEFEKLRRVNEIRPVFVFVRAITNPRGFVITMKNKGQSATSMNIISTSTDDFTVHRIKSGPIIENDQNIEIVASSNHNINSNLSSIQILIGFQDIDGNQYHQNVIKEVNKYRIQPPQKL